MTDYTPEQPAPSFAEQLRELRLDYAQRLPDHLLRIQSLSRACEQSLDVSAVAALQKEVHGLAGASGSFGFHQLGVRAKDVETKLSQLQAHTDDTQRRAAWLLLQDALSDLVNVDTALRSTANTVRSSSATDSPLTQPPQSNADSTTIWLVEDDDLLAKQLALQIGAFGYQVTVFNRFADAELAASQQEPDLILMDVQFSDENIVSTEELNKPGRLKALHCPLIFMSGADDFNARMASIRLGAAGYHVKPIDVARLVVEFDLLLRSRVANPERVLVFDDSRATASLIASILEEAGMQVRLIDAPEKLINTLVSFRPELVLMDYYVPRFTGAELTALIRQYREWLSLPVVYLSSERNANLQVEALACGGDEFLEKPVDPAHLVSTVRNRIERYRRLQTLINRDGLTGLLKHSTIKDAARNEVNRARRSGRPLSLVMLDIDHFKRVNDTYGHASGDLVISALGRLLSQCLRQSDNIGRYGGEEFLVLLPECADTDARRIIDDVRTRFEQVEFSASGEVFQCTFSAGVADCQQYADLSSDELLKVADEALYQAKRAGRNQVCVAN